MPITELWEDERFCLLLIRGLSNEDAGNVRHCGSLLDWWLFGRDGGIRTHDLVVPNDALYQAEPHPGKAGASDGNRTRDLFITNEVLYR